MDQEPRPPEPPPPPPVPPPMREVTKGWFTHREEEKTVEQLRTCDAERK